MQSTTALAHTDYKDLFLKTGDFIQAVSTEGDAHYAFRYFRGLSHKYQSRVALLSLKTFIDIHFCGTDSGEYLERGSDTIADWIGHIIREPQVAFDYPDDWATALVQLCHYAEHDHPEWGKDKQEALDLMIENTPLPVWRLKGLLQDTPFNKTGELSLIEALLKCERPTMSAVALRAQSLLEETELKAILTSVSITRKTTL